VCRGGSYQNGKRIESRKQREEIELVIMCTNEIIPSIFRTRGKTYVMVVVDDVG